MLLLRSERLPSWLLPVIGGLVLTAFAIVRPATAPWLFRTLGVTT